jgi:hypothetical protein
MIDDRTDPKPIRPPTAWMAEDSALIAREGAMWKALQEQDTLGFQRAMGSITDVDVSGIRRTTLGSVAKYVVQCRLASHALSDFRTIHDSLTAIVTYKAVVDETCWGQKAPSRPLSTRALPTRRAILAI